MSVKYSINNWVYKQKYIWKGLILQQMSLQQNW